MRPLRQDGETTVLPGPGEAAGLDPADRAVSRACAHRALDAAFDHLESVRDRPVWQPLSNDARATFDAPAPAAGEGAEAVLDEALRLVLPHTVSTDHPRALGTGGGNSVGGIVAALLAAAACADPDGGDDAVALVERQVVDWFRALFGLPEGTAGTVTGDGASATLRALAAARDVKADYDVRRGGVMTGGPALTCYTSAKAGDRIAAALELLGLGRDALRPVPVDRGDRMRVDALRRAVEEDRARGLRPFCVVGTAGTPDIGAIDDLTALAEVCAERGLWLHVDGGLGALAVLAPSRAGALAGIVRADSLVFDAHTWLQTPGEAACLLLRDGDPHAGTAGRRGVRALPLWLAMKEHGLTRLGAVVERCCALAQGLAERVRAHPELELMAPVPLNVVCFRYVDARLGSQALDRVNRAAAALMRERGIAAPSTARLAGALSVRAGLFNHRTDEADLDALVEATADLGRECAGAEPGARAREAG